MTSGLLKSVNDRYDWAWIIRLHSSKEVHFVEAGSIRTIEIARDTL
jgi:hypothetical protein